MIERSQHFPDLVRERSSVRAFETTPIDPGLVRQAIELAGWAPSPHGSQPWRFAVVAAQEARTRLSQAMAKSWREQLALDGDDADVIQRRVRRSQERLERAPVVVVMCLDLSRGQLYPDELRQRAEYLMAVQSLGAAAQNFLLAVHAQGLDAGWMCAPLFCPDVVRDVLGLSENLVPHAIFPIGRAAALPKRRPRLPVDDLIAAWE